jgi:hypothetical protein
MEETSGQGYLTFCLIRENPLSMRIPSLASPFGFRLSVVACAFTLVAALFPATAGANVLHDFFATETPVADCLNKSASCDPSLVIEKRLTTKAPLTLSPGVSLVSGTPIRAWYLGSASAQAKAIRAQGGAFATACDAADGGCLVLFADATLALPAGNKLRAQIGRFDRLNTVNFSKDAPGILLALISKKRQTSISLHGSIDLHGMPLRLRQGQLTEENGRWVVRGKLNITVLERGEWKNHLTIDEQGRWVTADTSFEVKSAGIGAYDLGDFTIEHGEKRTWTARVKAALPGLKPRVKGSLSIQDRAFHNVALADTLDAPLSETGLHVQCLRGRILSSKSGILFKGHLSLQGGKTSKDQARWRLNGDVQWDSRVVTGNLKTYINPSQVGASSTFASVGSKSFCQDTGGLFKGALFEGKMNLAIHLADGGAMLQGRLQLPKTGGLLITRPLRLHEGRLHYRGRGELQFPSTFALVGGDTVKRGEVHLEIHPTGAEDSVSLGWTQVGPSMVGLRVQPDDGTVTTFTANAEEARRATLSAAPTFASSDAHRAKKLTSARLVDSPQVSILRKNARGPDSEIQMNLVDIRELVDPSGHTLIRVDVRGVPRPATRLKTAWEMLNGYYTTPKRYELALSRETTSFPRPLYEPPRIVSPYLWGTKALRLQSRIGALGLTPTAVPSTLWGAWGLRSNLGCAGHFGARGYFGAKSPGPPVEGAEKRAFCWLGTRAHMGSRVDDVFDYPVGETEVGSVANELGTGAVQRPYKYNMMPGRSLKSCGGDRAPGVLDCDPYLVSKGLSCEEQQRYVGGTRVGSCAPVLHTYRPLTLGSKVVQFDEPQNYGTLREELRQGARSVDGSLTLPAGSNPLLQCPSELTNGALSKSSVRTACTRPGQFCRAYVDIKNGGVPSLGPAFECVAGVWQPVGLSPLEAAGFPKACTSGGSWESSIKRQGDKFIGTDKTRVNVTSQCKLVGSNERFQGLGWGWWGEISNAYCAMTPQGPQAGKAGGKSLGAALAERAFQSCSYAWNVSSATQDWETQLAGCDNPQASMTGPDFRECKFTSSMGMPMRLVAWDKEGTLYQWSPLELEYSSNDEASPRGERYSQAYVRYAEQSPAAGWSEDSQTVVQSAHECRDVCDKLQGNCVGYAVGGGDSQGCWIATSSTFKDGLKAVNLQTRRGMTTFLKTQPELFPSLAVGDSAPCGQDMLLKTPCSRRSNHTFILSPTNKKIGSRPASLSGSSDAHRKNALRHVLNHAPLMLDPSMRNRQGLRVMAITNRRLASLNGDSSAKGEKPSPSDEFAVSLSTQPSHLLPVIEGAIAVEKKGQSIEVKVKVPQAIKKDIHVRFFVDTDGAGYNGYPIGESRLDSKGAATIAWKGKPVGIDHNHAHHFYAMVFHRSDQGHRLAPPVLTPYADQTLQASPRISGRVSLGEGDRGGRCFHTVSEGETCDSIAHLYAKKPQDLMVLGASPSTCTNGSLVKGGTLSFSGSCGVQVFLDLNGDGVLQGEREPAALTDYQGRFSFVDVAAKGRQHLSFVIPSGFHSREDFTATFERESNQELSGSTGKRIPIESLESCQALCHPNEGETQGMRHEVRSDFKECGGVLHETNGAEQFCTLIQTSEGKRVLTKKKKAGGATLYVRSKKALGSIHRVLFLEKRPVVLPRLILHRTHP